MVRKCNRNKWCVLFIYAAWMLWISSNRVMLDECLISSDFSIIHFNSIYNDMIEVIDGKGKDKANSCFRWKKLEL